MGSVLHLAHNLYSAMWSNMWAPSIWTLLGIGISHIHQVWLHNKHHDELMGR